MNSHQMSLENSSITVTEPERPAIKMPINLNPTGENNPFEDQLVMQQINRQLIQENRLKGVMRQFTIFNGSHLHVIEKRKHHQPRSFHIKLELLDKKPEQSSTVAFDWLITTVISSLVTCLMIYLSWFGEMEFSSTTSSIITTLSISISAIFLLTTLLKTESRVELFTRYGRIPIIKMLHNSPNQKEFSQFVDSLSRYIDLAQQHGSLATKELLSQEIKELRALHGAGMIPLESYEQAKTDIFSHEAFSSSSS
ncbi:MAG: hypothetical protein OQK78_12790 [Gammaproteobacteria bacterium]|nr:hypothetical protein [Gammaproteobacteria bacterium]